MKDTLKNLSLALNAISFVFSIFTIVHILRSMKDETEK